MAIGGARACGAFEMGDKENLGWHWMVEDIQVNLVSRSLYLSLRSVIPFVITIINIKHDMSCIFIYKLYVLHPYFSLHSYKA